MQSSPIYDALIVGAGFSGLAAAAALTSAGKSVLVLEARDRVGGRVKPGSIAGTAIDLGGMWVGSAHKRLLGLIDAHKLKTYPTWLDGEAMVELLGRRVRCPREDFAKALPLNAKLEFGLLAGKLKRLINSVLLSDPAKSPRAVQLDAISLGEWMRRNVRTKGLSLILTLITRSVFCAEPDEVSFLHWLTYLKAGGGLDALVSAEPGGAQHLMVDGGLHQLATKMAEPLGDYLVTEAQVMAVEHVGEHVQIATTRGAFFGRRAIIALPPSLAGQFPYYPELSHARDAIHQRLPMGSVIKCWIAYERPFWRDAGLNGFISSDASGFSPCFDVSPPHGPGLIAGFFDASEASIWSPRGGEARRAEVISLLVRTLGARAATPIDYAENDWTMERWSRGCYAAYAPPGVWTRFGAALRNPVGLIHWAGTETATEHTGYVEGALQAGERAGIELIAALT